MQTGDGLTCLAYGAGMPRAAPVSPVNAKMYRHFAIISLSITACLAMFANAENQDALEKHLSDENEQQAAQSQTKAKKSFSFRDNRTATGSFGAETGPTHTNRSTSLAIGTSDYNTGPELVAGSKVTFVPDTAVLAADSAVHGLPPGMTPEEIRQWRELQEKRHAAGEQSEPNTLDIAAMLAASRRRSQTPGS